MTENLVPILLITLTIVLIVILFIVVSYIYMRLKSLERRQGEHVVLRLQKRKRAAHWGISRQGDLGCLENPDKHPGY